ncbi:MAG TPA: flagellar basal body-associated FliL family protein [Pirellulaceae bacterium]|nr:flagellar basal body-associated FliL family protein [Pirellulaceae bacterium]
MADEEKVEAVAEKKSGSLGKIAVWLVVIVVSIGSGFATPLVVAKLTAPPSPPEMKSETKPTTTEDVEFIDFDEVVAVLGKSKFSRYLKLNFSLQVPKSQRAFVEKKISQRTAVLRNRIIAHLAETTEEDLAGQHGHNQLRRQIHRFFNEVLFDDGIERIQDVLFREFQVQ